MKTPLNIAIHYKLTGTGWSECALEVYGAQCVVTASYLSDALLALISGVNHVLDEGNEARFSFDEEPGEYRWKLQRSDKELAVQILEFPELWGDKPDSDGKLLFDVRCNAKDFAAALLLTLDELLDRHGLDGYHDTWSESAFPVLEYEKLCAHLDAPCSDKLGTKVRLRKRSQRSDRVK